MTMRSESRRTEDPTSRPRRRSTASILAVAALVVAGLGAGTAAVVALASGSATAGRDAVGPASGAAATPSSSPTVAVPTVPAPPVDTAALSLAPNQTVVSLTFDDGNSDQMGAAEVMAKYGLKGTFYIISGSVGSSGYVTRADLDTLAAQGNEIGGHTVSHPDLTTLSPDEAKKQICFGRETLMDWGFPVRSFAYPYAASSPAVEKIVAECGYNSARGLGDVAPEFQIAAESVPPANPFLTKAPSQVDGKWKLEALQEAVTNAQAHGGGWVQLTFHHYDGHGSLSVSAHTFTRFVEWLAEQSASHDIVVRTVGDVIGGPVRPVVPTSISTGPVLAPGVDGIVNGDLEKVSDPGVPTCWWESHFGTNDSEFSLVEGRSSKVASRIVMTDHTDGDAKLLPAFDLGECTPTIAEGHTYSLRSWYTSSTVTQFAVYLRNDLGGWEYWTSSPWFKSSSEWRQAEWTTPAVPPGYTGISFGLDVFRVGELTTDDVAIYDTDGAPPLDPQTAK